MKTQMDSAWRASGLMDTWRFRETGAFGEGIEAPRPFPIPSPLQLFHLAVPELHPFTTNQWSSR